MYALGESKGKIDMENTGTTRRQNIEQERGREAWNDIQSIKDSSNKDLEKKYRSLARGLNAMIQINGLGQTLGFLCAKSKRKENSQDKQTEHNYLLGHLSKWMRDTNHFKASNSSEMGTNYDGLLTWVINKDTTSADYRRATTECLAFGVWLRRFAEATLEGEES
jgi:CRISPR-associated protein Cmr5